jgi:hypothetical protein
MAEDSGAFKTNPAKSRQIQAFVIRQRRCRHASPSEKNSPAGGRPFVRAIFNKRSKAVAVFLK